MRGTLKQAARVFVTGLLLAGFLIAGSRMPLNRLIEQAFAAGNSCQSNTASGNWTVAGSWTNCGGTTPQPADTVEILNGHNITMNTNPAVTDVTIDNGGTLTVSGSNTLTISGSYANAGTFTAATGTVLFSATTTGKTISGTLNGSSSFNKVVFNGTGGGWTTTSLMRITSTGTDAVTVSAGTLTLGDSSGDNLELGGRMNIATTSNETATVQFPTLSYPGKIYIYTLCTTDVVCIGGSSIQTKVLVGATSGSGVGTLTMNKNSLFGQAVTDVTVQDTGVLTANGQRDVTGALITSTDTPGQTDTTLCTSTALGAGSADGKSIRMTSGLAKGQVFTATSTQATDSTCANNGDSSLSYIGIESVATGAGINWVALPAATATKISGADHFRSVCTSWTDSDWTSSAYSENSDSPSGRYLRDNDTNSFYEIIGQQNNNSEDFTCSGNDISVYVTDYPSSFSDLGNGDDIAISSGVKTGDSFDIIQYSFSDNSRNARQFSSDPYDPPTIITNAGSQTTIDYALADIVSCSGLDAANANEDLTISNSYLTEGVTLDACANTAFTDNSYGTVYIQFSGWKTIWIKSNSSTNTFNGGELWDGNFIIEGSNNLLDGISTMMFRQNVFDTDASIEVASGTGNVIANALVTGEGTLTARSAINIEADNTTVRGTTVRGNGGHAIITSANGTTLSGNTIDRNFSRTQNGFAIIDNSPGALVITSDGNLIDGNTITNNFASGIVFQDGSDNIARGNIINNNDTAGIYVYNNEGQLTLASNTITDNAIGLYNNGNLTSSFNDTITSNYQSDVVKGGFKPFNTLKLQGSTFSTLQRSAGFGLPDGQTTANVIDTAYDNGNSKSNTALVFLDDGTYAVAPLKNDLGPLGYTASGDGYVSFSATYPYTLAAGKTPADVVGVSEDGWNTHDFAFFYTDGTYSETNLGNVATAGADIIASTVHNYTLPGGKTPTDIVSVEQEIWNTGRLAFFFSDGSYAVTAGAWDISSDVDASTETHNYSLPTNRDYTDIVGVNDEGAFDGRPTFYYTDGTIDLAPLVNNDFGDSWDAASDLQLASSQHGATQLSGQTASDVVAYAYDGWEERMVAFYNDGSFGSTDYEWDPALGTADLNFSNHNYTLAAGKTTNDIVGITEDLWSSNRLAIFYSDGTYSASDSNGDSDGDMDVPNVFNYTLSGTHVPADIIAVASDGWTTGKLAVFYNDGTYSVTDDNSWNGTADVTFNTEHDYTIAGGKSADQIVGISTEYAFYGELQVWYSDGSYSLSEMVNGWDADADVVADMSSSSTIASLGHNSGSGSRIWGNYNTPADDAVTPQDESVTQFNYADNLWTDGVVGDTTNITYDISSADLSGGPYAYQVVQTAANGGVCDGSGGSATYELLRNGTDLGEVLCGDAYTDSTGGVNVTFTLTSAATADYLFLAFPNSTTTNSQKTVTMMDDGGGFSVLAGRSIELIGQNATTNKTILTRGGSGGYGVVVAGSIEANGFTVSYLGGNGGQTGLTLLDGATVADLSNGTFNNFQASGATDTFVTVHGNLIGTGTPSQTFDGDTFTQAASEPIYSITESDGSPVTGNYWLFSAATCTNWSSCEDSDSDTGDGAGAPNADGFIRFGAAIPPSTFSIAGIVYSNDEVTPLLSAPTVRVKINGLGSYSTTASSSDGSYSIANISMSSGDKVVAYLDTAGGSTGETVTHATGADIDDLDIYMDRLATRCHGSCSLTNTDISSWDKSDDDDIHATVSGGNLTVDNDWKLLVSTDTFNPGAMVTTSSGGSNTYSGDVEVKSGATLNGANSIQIGGNVTNGGTFTAGSGTVTLAGTRTQTVSGSFTSSNAFYNLTITNGSGSDTGTACSAGVSVPSVAMATDVTVGNIYTIADVSAVVHYKTSGTFRVNKPNWYSTSHAQQIVFRHTNNTTGQWLLVLTGSPVTAVTDVSVANSDASTGNTIDATNATNTDFGNNAGWSFATSSILPCSSSSGGGSTGGGSTGGATETPGNPVIETPDTPVDDTPITTTITPVIETATEVPVEQSPINPLIAGLNQVLAVVAVAGGVLLYPPITSIVLISIINGLNPFSPFFFAYLPKRKKRLWGQVYDESTGVPVLGVFVELIDQATGQRVKRQMSDRTGSYGFIAPKSGTYKLRINNPLYQPYLGPSFTVVGAANEIISRDIGLVVKQEEWSLQMVKAAAIIRFFSLLTKLHWLVLIGGSIISVYIVAVYPSVIAWLIVGVYAAIWLAKLLLARRQRHAGFVRAADTDAAQVNVVVQLVGNRSGRPVIVGSTLTDSHGHFLFTTRNGQFNLIFAKGGYKPTTVTTHGEEVNMVIKLQPNE